MRAAVGLQSLVPAVPAALAWTMQTCPGGRLGKVTLAAEVSIFCTTTVGAGGKHHLPVVGQRATDGRHALASSSPLWMPSVSTGAAWRRQVANGKMLRFLNGKTAGQQDRQIALAFLRHIEGEGTDGRTERRPLLLLQGGQGLAAVAGIRKPRQF